MQRIRVEHDVGVAVIRGVRSCREFAAGCRDCDNITAGAFCRVVRGAVRGIGRISACVGCGMVVFVGYRGVDGSGF